MNRTLADWADAHRPHALDLVRIYLGLGLLVRGVVFLVRPDAYFELLPGRGADAFSSVALMHYVGLAHVGGGLLLALGALTRVAALVQLPILLGATLVVHFPDGLLVADQSFAFSALVLFLLGVFAVWGGGPLSLDRFIAERNLADEAEEDAEAERELRTVRARERAGPATDRSPAQQAVPACACGHGRDHERVRGEPRYGFPGVAPFVFGVHATPRSVQFTCKDCGGVVDESTDPETREAYRYWKGEA